jgi:hypothetical protein
LFPPCTAGNEKLEAMLTDMLVAGQLPAAKKKSASTVKAKKAPQKKSPVIKGGKVGDATKKSDYWIKYMFLAY